jgi:beta-lactamase superfamily II metal-dependent hydrolase
MKTKKFLFTLTAAIAILLALFWFFPRDPELVVASEVPTVKVHFMDVGQGDATLLHGPDFTILVDAGRHDRNDVVPYLKSMGIESIDLLIGTHPHADHIGQFPEVLEAFEVQEVWMSGGLHTTLIFERTLDAILSSNAAYNEPRMGHSFTIGSATIDVLSPHEITGDLNDDSVVTRIQFGDVNFLFAGDAEIEAEREMVRSGHDLSATILQVGHHGSRTSSTIEFLEAVQPEIAIYSAGRDNRYEHPHPEIVDRYEQMDITLYGTDQYGTIIVESDGTGYSISFSSSDTLQEPIAFDDSASAECININTAGTDELSEIIHIGPSRASELIHNRPYDSIEELIQIRGMGSTRVEAIIAEGLACVENQ